jgi:hypothetical protein
MSAVEFHSLHIGCDVVVYAVIGFGEPHKWLVVTDEISVRGRRPPRLKIRHRLFACCRIRRLQ